MECAAAARGVLRAAAARDNTDRTGEIVGGGIVDGNPSPAAAGSVGAVSPASLDNPIALYGSGGQPDLSSRPTFLAGRTILGSIGPDIASQLDIDGPGDINLDCAATRGIRTA